MKKNNLWMLVTGQISLFFGLAGFLLNTFFLYENPVVAFLTGLFLGLSLVLNLVFLSGIRKRVG